MRADSNAGLTPGDVLKSKSAMQTRKGRGGQIVLQGKRRPRGNRGTANQAEWVEDFIQSAQMAKIVGPCTFGQATAFADSPIAGYTFWRDYLSTPYAGKFLDVLGDSGDEPQTPRILSLREDENFRVTTPTANVNRLTAEALTSGVGKVLTPNNLIWDNNAFWNPSALQTRLTCKAAGLYQVHAWVAFAVGGTMYRQIALRVNGSETIALQSGQNSSSNSARLMCSILWPFHAGDYVELTTQANGTGQTAKIEAFQIVGITPETIV